MPVYNSNVQGSARGAGVAKRPMQHCRTEQFAYIKADQRPDRIIQLVWNRYAEVKVAWQHDAAMLFDASNSEVLVGGCPLRYTGRT